MMFTVDNKFKPIPIDRPVIVEGKYDKIKLSSVISANIITTEGFGIFNSEEKTALIRRLAERHGVIVLTDSDGAGLVIRNYFNSVLPRDKVTHLYIPEVIGKERRKKSPSKAGTLGVEGIEIDYFRRLFEPFAADASKAKTELHPITKSDFYADGFAGTDGSSDKRIRLAKKLGLPTNLSANAMISAINMLYTHEEYDRFVEELHDEAVN